MLHPHTSWPTFSKVFYVVAAVALYVGCVTIGAWAQGTGATHVVTSTADDGPGSFRAALTAAQAGDRIIFDPQIFPPTSPVTIAVQSELPTIRMNGLTIDASQAGVVLDGRGQISGSGLTIEGAHNVTLRGLQISHFSSHGIEISSGAENIIIGGDRTQGYGNIINQNGNRGIGISDKATRNVVVQGNYIGVDRSGQQAAGNQGAGIHIEGTQHQIGGLTAGLGNVISANGGSGIDLTADAAQVVVQGNYIGVDSDGHVALGNRADGISIDANAQNNVIGGAVAGARNVISGNRNDGVSIIATRSNTVQGNYIGVDQSGLHELGNGNNGISITQGASNNQIGGSHPTDQCTLACNLISGNGLAGIYLQNTDTTQNRIQGNWIGVDSTGQAALGNREAGIHVHSAQSNSIGEPGIGNLISGNQQSGIFLVGSSGATMIQGNWIGVNHTGTASLGNGKNGIEIFGSNNNLIGGNAPGTGNLISGNQLNGISLVSTRDNRVQGNWIGVDAKGEQALGNSFTGIQLGFQAVQNIIGGAAAGDGNLISGNKGAGLIIQGQEVQNNQVIGNAIGLDRTGRNRLGNGGDGLVILTSGGQNQINHNVVRFNGGLALRLSLGNSLLANTFADNRYNFAYVAGGELTTQNETWSRQGELTTYIVTDKGISVPAGRTWAVNAGVTVQFDFGKGAVVAGTLTANGTITQPVKFTSSQRFVAPLPGGWRGITFQTGSQGQLSFTSIEFAQDGMTVAGGNVQLAGSTVAASQQHGIWLQSGVVSFQGENSLAGNGQLALRNDSPSVVQAANIWWGSASGPQAADNPNGRGDAISADVAAVPYITNPMPKNDWRTAPVLRPGDHAFAIQHERDVQWFRFPVGQRNGVLTANLGKLPRDYDLFLFTGMEQALLTPEGTGHVQSIDRSEAAGHVQSIPGQAPLIEGCSPTYLGQVADLSQIDALSHLLTTSCQAGNTAEQVRSEIWNQSGWYYLLVAGHNGVFAPTQPYTLNIQLTNALPTTNSAIPNFTPPSAVNPQVQTLILTHRQRLLERYPLDQVNTLWEKLNNLAAQANVVGEIIDLSSFDEAQKLAPLYAQWDSEPGNVARANQVADGIKALLISRRSAYPALINLVLVGGDEIIPFYRVPDETTIGNEESYHAFALTNSPLAAALQNSYFFSDNYYASFNPIPWRGRELGLPTYAIGRLVETPVEMSASISRFIQQPVITINNTLVIAYDFLRDLGNAVSQALQSLGIDPNQLSTLINNSWDADALRAEWLHRHNDLSSINGHFDHYRAIPAAEGSGEITPDEVSQSPYLSGALIFSVGCHAGLSVAHDQVTGQALDFAQVLVGKGATYLANTGYGYGDANAIGYSERLMQLFAQRLADSSSVGEALVRAKGQYFNELGVQSITPYDEKILNVATLYGLPMLRVQFAPNLTATTAAAPPNPWQISPPAACRESGNLSCRQATFTPTFETTTSPDGIYYSVVGESPQVVAGQPIQPRASVSVTLPVSIAHGVLFEGGRYLVANNFNPIVAQLITQTRQLANGQQIAEPTYPQTRWRPTAWALINTARTPAGRQQRLVVLPAQYSATSPSTGIERRFTEMNFSIYYSTSRDVIAPYIWLVQYQEQSTGTIQVQVQADDISQVVRVVLAYTVGDGIWHTQDLTKPDLQSPWQGALPNQPGLEFFVQAVDGAGNVALDDNRGAYFWVEKPFFLPMIFQR